MYPPASFCVSCCVDNSGNTGGVECVNVAGAGAVCGSEHLSLEICGSGIRAFEDVDSGGGKHELVHDGKLDCEWRADFFERCKFC